MCVCVNVCADVVFSVYDGVWETVLCIFVFVSFADEFWKYLAECLVSLAIVNNSPCRLIIVIILCTGYCC